MSDGQGEGARPCQFFYHIFSPRSHLLEVGKYPSRWPHLSRRAARAEALLGNDSRALDPKHSPQLTYHLLRSSPLAPPVDAPAALCDLPFLRLKALHNLMKVFFGIPI